jgi:hypothetical protein
MVEAIANGVEDFLIDGLSYKLKSGASYITQRRQSTFHPSGSNVYKAEQGTKLIKIQLNGDSWLDPSTVRIMFALENNDPVKSHLLRNISGPWCFFRRMRILCGGQIIEDIDNYNRTHEMMSLMYSDERRDNDDIEGFGQRIKDPDQGVLDAAVYTGVFGNNKRVVGFKLLAGIFEQTKYLPLRYCPIVIELELVNSKYEPIIKPLANDGPQVHVENTSIDWTISDVQLKCDLCTLDNALDNEYAQHLLEGKALPINYNTFVTQNQAISGTNVSINVSRALSRLKTIFITFLHSDSAANSQVSKEFNGFYHPMSEKGGPYDSTGELEYQIQIGSKLYPEYPVRSLSEAFSKLKQCVYGADNNFHSISFTAKQYQKDTFIIGIDTEKVPGAGFTGLNTKSGDLITIKVKAQQVRGDGVGTESGILSSEMPTNMFITLFSDNIMEIRDTGVSVYD